MHTEHTHAQGSILIFALIAMGVIALLAAGIASTAMQGMQSATVMDDAAAAFQVADTGVESILYDLQKGGVTTIGGFGSCESGTVTKASGQGSARITFYTRDASMITTCDKDIWEAATAKSVGLFGRATRAIQFVLPQAQRGLLGYWEFDDGAGFIGTDTTTRKNNAQISAGTTWTTPGVIGTSAVRFNGTSNHVDIPDHADYHLTKGAFSMWIKPTADANADRGILTTGDDHRATGWMSLMMTGSGATRSIVLRVSGNSGADTIIASGAATVTTGSWHHIVVTFDHDAWTVWINGVQKLSQTVSDTNGIKEQNDAIILGRSNAASCGGSSDPTNTANDWRCYYAGDVDDVRLYDHVLTDGEIRALHALGN